MDTVNLPFPALSPSSRSTVVKHACISLLRVRTIKSLFLLSYCHFKESNHFLVSVFTFVLLFQRIKYFLVINIGSSGLKGLNFSHSEGSFNL